MVLHELAVLVAQLVGHHRHLPSGLDVLEADRVVVGEVDLVGVEDVEHDHVVAREAQGLDRVEHLLRLLVEVGDDGDDAGPLEELRRLVERRPQRAGPARRHPVEGVQRDLEVLGGRRHPLDDVVVEGHDAHPVALLRAEVAEAGGEEAAVVELGQLVAAEAHRLRDVEEHREVGVGVGLELLDVEPVGPGPEPPVDAPDVVARHVAAVLGEVDGHAQVRRLVQAVDEPLDHEPRGQLEAADPGQHLRIDEPGAGRRGGSVGRHGYICETGVGTTSMSWSMIWSVVMPSDSAWKLRSTRCRITGWARARMSSKLTW